MKHRLRTARVILILAASNAALAQPPEPPASAPHAKTDITVLVLHPDGRPVAGADVGAFVVHFESEAPGTLNLTLPGESPARSHRTDDSGSLTLDGQTLLPGEPGTRPSPLIALSRDRTLIGMTQVRREQLGGKITIQMARACRVTVRLKSTSMAALGRGLSWTNVYVRWDQTRPMAVFGERQVHELLLPPGEYSLVAYGTDTYNEVIKVQIAPDESERRIDLDLRADRLTHLIGKPAPELAQIKGWKSGGPVSLADLRGKVVLLDFWGYWCGPCVHAMPDLMQTHEKYKDKGLVIIAVHDDSTDSIATMDSNLARIRADLWGGNDLPFLVALDGGGEMVIPGCEEKARGATTSAYGITAFPTQVLIDRDGNVIGKRRKGNDDQLPQLLGPP
ncbi:Thiol-disulfide oxidoreductase ResA [Phycisphaerales bacterium]|nr:Thiol-disulfide oxidoreductase ResA [Phycisphaerales bacterium]